MTTDSWMTAAQAARALGITHATLYAYVSRGLIRSQAGPGPSRARRYARDDVERVKRRSEERRNPDKVAAHALQWGMPVLESSITLIANGTLYYRGCDAIQLGRSASVARVASLIWTGRDDETFDQLSVPSAPTSKKVSFIARTQAALALASASDEQSFDLRPTAVARTGWRILHLMTNAADGRARGASIDAALARAWRVRAGGEDLIRAALILCADHELNVSAFTARCVASARSNPYAVVIAALSALEGIKHGGSAARVESLLVALRRERGVRTAIAERLKLGQHVDGLGHPLYRSGDPRAKALLTMLGERFPRSSELRFVRDVEHAARGLTSEHPNLDFALAAVAQVLGAPRGSALTLFAIGRAIGWIGHAIEQYALDQIIRPRARYVGPSPEAG